MFWLCIFFHLLPNTCKAGLGAAKLRWGITLLCKNENLINWEIPLQLRCCTFLNRIQTNPKIRHAKEEAGAIPLQKALNGAYWHRCFWSKSADYALSWEKNPPWWWNSGALCVARSSPVVCICVGWWIKHQSTLYLIEHSPAHSFNRFPTFSGFKRGCIYSDLLGRANSVWSCHAYASSLINFEPVSQFQLNLRVQGMLMVSEMRHSFELCENKRF